MDPLAAHAPVARARGAAAITPIVEEQAVSASANQGAAGPPEAKQHKVDGLLVYVRNDKQGKAARLDAIDVDARKIRTVADRLQRRGYGVMRQRHPRAGKVYYVFKASWAGRGEPPEDPFSLVFEAR